jgi:predicted CXXCH cytochrome family protein
MSSRSALVIWFFIALVMFAGCEPRSSYKVLSFFFDGVPDPDKVIVSTEKTDVEKPKVSLGSTHGPFASKRCGDCHKREQGNQLVLPKEKLCLKCHQLNFEGMNWVHGPVASGGCRVCHNPHQSAYPSLLDAPQREVCFRCHEERAVMENVVHQDVASGCLDCHDAHASQQKFLLK